MQLAAIDWWIIAGYLVFVLVIGALFRRRAGKGLAAFFISGRSLPWWIAGTSMVATTFAVDTPLAVTGFVAKNGLAGNWLWWAMAAGGMVTVFVFARLWRRAEVLTDVELIELRYSGRVASFLRGFRSVYMAALINSLVIGWVTSAMLTVLEETVLWNTASDSATTAEWLWILGMLAVVGVYSTLSGLWGVAVTDAVQFVLAMVGCIVLAWIAVDHVGGVEALKERVTGQQEAGEQVFSFLPDFTASDPFMPVGVFLVMLTVQWWATWYPGQEPGGGGYVVQRMAACRDERHAVLATLWFQVAHYCLRPWPWLMVAFVALALHPELHTWAVDKDEATRPESGFPMMIRELAPAGLRGLLLVTFGAAFMSTISTQMNWGASYLVNDVYRRFLRPDADDRQLARAGRVASVLVLVLGGVVAFWMKASGIDVGKAWKLMLALGAGTGAVFMLRWFWWRVNAWTEIAAMVSSLAFFAFFTEVVEVREETYRMALVAGCTIAVWLGVTWATAPVDWDVLERFYRKVRPAGPGWKPVAARAADVEVDRDLGRSLLAALLGTAVIYTVLPGVGAVIFGEWLVAGGCAAGAVLAAGLLLALRPWRSVRV